ncbi:transposase [Candidatus Phycosocius bacilliformis]|uniref:transposase n=1 Tax=Candidatus Phycosocius bacilliformis TaxID=1445552 RepID=UPI000D5981BD
METLQAIAAGYGRRLDVVETGRRRRLCDNFKQSVVEENYAAGAVMTQLARRYGVHPSQIYSSHPARATAWLRALVSASRARVLECVKPPWRACRRAGACAGLGDRWY